MRGCFVFLLVFLCTGTFAQGVAASGQRLYAQHCAGCHGTDRLGGTGPALLPQNLKRLKPENAARVIRRGAAATQMPAFDQTLSESDIASLVALIYTPLDRVPAWELEQIIGSHVAPGPQRDTGDRPVFSADPLNLFVVVESGDHHATILDGDTFEPIHRFKTRFALHGGPKFSTDGRYVYFASRDGWVTKYDLYKLQVLAEVRAGINTRNVSREMLADQLAAIADAIRASNGS